MAVGSFSRGPPLAVVPMTGDTMTSEPGFSPAVDAKFKGTGNDYMRGDAERRHMRLDGHGVLEYVTNFARSPGGFLLTLLLL